FADGILGPELMEIMKKQAVRFGTGLIFGDVTAVDLKKRPFRVSIGKEQHLAETLIVATGATAKLLGLPAEKRLMRDGLSACATSRRFLFTDHSLLLFNPRTPTLLGTS